LTLASILTSYNFAGKATPQVTDINLKIIFTNEHLSLTSLSKFQPGLTFAGKAGAYPKVYLKGRKKFL
jgi:hypothetical protein